MKTQSQNRTNRIVVPAKLVFRTLIVISLAIVLVGTSAHLLRHQAIGNLDDPKADVLKRFDLVEEPSLIQWYSSSLHLSVSLLNLGIGLSIGRDKIWHWLGITAIFLMASLDESVMIHEMMDRPTRELLGTSGLLSIAWIIPGTLIALTITILFLSFLKSLERETRNQFLIAGAVFLTGAIAMEIPGGYLYEKYAFTTWHYIASYALEEFLELSGICLFIAALLNLLETRSSNGILVCQSNNHLANSEVIR